MVEFDSVIGAYVAPGDVEDDLLYAVERALEWRTRRSGKRCSKCEETKAISAFGADATRQDGLRHICRGCRR